MLKRVLSPGKVQVPKNGPKFSRDPLEVPGAQDTQTRTPQLNPAATRSVTGHSRPRGSFLAALAGAPRRQPQGDPRASHHAGAYGTSPRARPSGQALVLGDTTISDVSRARFATDARRNTQCASRL